MINKMTDKLSVSEYIRLIRAGYTAEQIEQEYGTEPSDSAPEPIIEPAEETVTEPEKPAEAPKPSRYRPAIHPLMHYWLRSSFYGETFRKAIF